MNKQTSKISQSSFTIEANGFADGPAQPFRDYLLAHHAKKVVFINHPLVAEGAKKHVVTTYQKGTVRTKDYRLPNKPPYTFLFDPLVPARPTATTAWFGFNNLAANRGLKLRKAGKVKKVYYWAVDFVPDRFGTNPLTKVYNRLDKKVCQQVDARIELSQAACDGRTKYLGLSKNTMAPTELIPMGTWFDRTAKTSPSSIKKKKIVYMGHHVERQGVETLLRALKILVTKDPEITAETIGSGPLLDDLKSLSKELGLQNNITFHGFVKDYTKAEAILASGCIAVAPYKKDPNNFTQFADPGKLKAYLGAGLPIVLTDVPPNAHELEKDGVAKVVKDQPEAIAKAVAELLKDSKKWATMRTAALKKAKEFDWNVLFERALKQFGFVD